MDSMLNLISLTLKFMRFLVQIYLRRPYLGGTVIIPQCYSRRKADVKFVNIDIYIYIYIYILHLYIYVYVCVIMKAMCRPGYNKLPQGYCGDNREGTLFS